jgi:hypothetical protein
MDINDVKTQLQLVRASLGTNRPHDDKMFHLASHDEESLIAARYAAYWAQRDGNSREESNSRMTLRGRAGASCRL